MKLFAALKSVRDFERSQLTFIRYLVDIDIVIEIGYAQEQQKPLTPKPLFLLKLGPVSTVRRRLAKLTEQGIVIRRANPNDLRSEVLTLSSSSHKLMGKFGGVLSSFGVVA